jgi:hypothetical protein
VHESEKGEETCDIFLLRMGYFVNQIWVKKTGLRNWIEVGLNGLK